MICHLAASSISGCGLQEETRKGGSSPVLLDCILSFVEQPLELLWSAVLEFLECFRRQAAQVPDLLLQVGLLLQEGTTSLDQLVRCCCFLLQNGHCSTAASVC